MTDADAEKYLKMFTLLPISEIAEVIETHKVSMYFNCPFSSQLNSVGFSLNPTNG